jgi:hypothetical protein
VEEEKFAVESLPDSDEGFGWAMGAFLFWYDRAKMFGLFSHDVVAWPPA